jgi:hypothetical protein
MGVCFGEGNCYTGAFITEKGRSLWQPTKQRNAHIRFVRVRSLRKSIAARSARRWKKPRTWIVSAPIRSARVERNTRPTHSRRRRPTRRIRTPFIGVSSTVQIVAGEVGPGNAINRALTGYRADGNVIVPAVWRQGEACWCTGSGRVKANHK